MGKQLSKEEYLLDVVTKMSCKHKVDITGDEKQWKKLCCSITNTFKETEDNGRKHFHLLSEIRPGYELVKANVLFDECLTSNNKISFASFMYYAEKAGIIRHDYLIAYQDDYEVLPF